MIIRIRLGHWRFTLTLYEVTDITGVNSQLKDGNHILMWDFDNKPLRVIEVALSWVQWNYGLPNIYILNTGKLNHYIAYCFERCEWKEAVEIVAATPCICEDYFKWGVFRKRFTLRVTPKEGRKPKLVKILYSPIPEGVNVSELTSWVKDTQEETELRLPLSHLFNPEASSHKGTILRHLDVSTYNTRL